MVSHTFQIPESEHLHQDSNHFHRKEQEKKDQNKFKDKELHIQEHEMELELQHASSIPVPDEGTLQQPLYGILHDATLERQSITRQARETTSYESDEPPQTNQQMEDVTSEPPPTSPGLEEGTSGSVHIGSVQHSIHNL